MDFVLSCLGGKNLTKGGRTMAGADVAKIDHSDVPIRLFKSDFLEFFTHIHPAVVVAIWLPVALVFLVQAINGAAPGAPTAYIPIGFLLGIFVWTLTEYTVHRFVFHFAPKNPPAWLGGTALIWKTAGRER